MGIYGALSTAVSGLRAQAHALENISGNIANSQTTAYKRIETEFVDMIPDAPVKRQVAGAVMAQSRGTTNENGDIKAVSNETFVALSSSGFFVVEPKTGTDADGAPSFSGASYYTRRGDFEIDKDGLLVNGAGYYLKGLAIDPVSGNLTGGTPGVIKLSNAFLPAQRTARINYQANLPELPKTTAYDATDPGSELLDTVDYADAATINGTSNLVGTANMASIATPGQTVTLTAGAGRAVVFEFYDGAGGPFAATATAPAGPPPGVVIGIDIRTTPTPVSIDAALADMQTKFRDPANGTSAATATIGLSNGQIRMTLGSAKGAGDTLTSASTATGMGIPAATDGPDTPLARLDKIAARNDSKFKANSIDGGQITVYAQNGAPASVTMRWAKIDSAASGGVDTWNLYYVSNGNAKGDDAMWTRVDQDYTFGPDGSMSPPIAATTIPQLKVNGVDVGEVVLNHGIGGMTQQADVNGKASTSTLNQNGYGSGEYISASIDDSGRVVASYSNGQRIDVAQVVTAQFNAVNQLKRLDGGVYVATTESGEPMIDQTGTGIVGSSLESSNSDISDEFTKLIITQQAYAANTKIVSTANDMLQQALNMIR